MPDPFDPELGDWVYVYNHVGTVYGNSGTIAGVEYTTRIESLVNAGFMSLTTRPISDFKPGTAPYTPPVSDNSLVSAGTVKEIMRDYFLGDEGEIAPWVDEVLGDTRLTLIKVRDEVEEDKKTVLAHTQALAEPNDAAVLGLISEGADTATKAALNATYAQRLRLRHIEVFDSFFGGMAGAHPDPRWYNADHLTTDGYAQMAAHVADATDDQGHYVIGGGKITFLGNSWFVQGGSAWGNAILARTPSATIVNAGVSGNRSQALLDRFDTDVPADSDYVVFNEPGVNDIVSGVSTSTAVANLERLVAKIQAIGAIPVYVGIVPLSSQQARSEQWHTLFEAIIGNGTVFPGVPTSAIPVRYPIVDMSKTPNETSIGVGPNSLTNTTGGGNTGLGTNTLSFNTSGTNNTAVGEGALYNSTGSKNTGIGTWAGLKVTTGSNNAAFGYGALHTPGGSSANATTTGSSNTAGGVQSGAAGAGLSFTSTFGYRATAGGNNSTAIGAGATVAAGAHGAVAIGQSSAGAGAVADAENEIALGTDAHNVKVRGRLNVAPRTPSSSADTQGKTGDIAADDSYVFVKTSAGWKRVALSTF